MSQTFQTLWTDIGRAKLAQAMTDKTKLGIKKMQFGDGAYSPVAAMTKLTNKVHEVDLAALTIDTNNANYLIAEAVLADDIGGFYVREIGLTDDVGDLLVIANIPETYKPEFTQGAGKELIMRVIMEVSNTDTVTLIADPTIAIASRTFVERQMRDHNQDTDAHPNLTPPNATHTQRGIAELATDQEVVDGADPARIVTPATLKVWGDDKLVQATTSELGLVELATMEEAAAGLDDTHAVTPAGLKSWGGGVEQAFADLALRHALEQEATLITGPRYQGINFTKTKSAASSSAGWIYRRLWYAGAISPYNVEEADFDKQNWNGAITGGVIHGDPAANQRLSVQAFSDNWEFAFTVAALDSPAEGKKSAGQIRAYFLSPVPSRTNTFSFSYNGIPLTIKNIVWRSAYSERRASLLSNGRLQMIGLASYDSPSLGETGGILYSVLLDVEAENGGWLEAPVDAVIEVTSDHTSRSYFQVDTCKVTKSLTGGRPRNFPRFGFFLNEGPQADLTQDLSLPVTFRTGSEQAIMVPFINGQGDEETKTIPGNYLGHRYRFRRADDKLTLYDDTSRDSGGDAVLLHEWTIQSLTQFGIQTNEPLQSLRLEKVTLGYDLSVTDQASVLRIPLSKTASVPARIAMAMRMADADVTGLTAEASRDGGVRWINMSLDHARLDEAGRAIITGSAGWPADTPAGRDLQLRFTAQADTQYQLFGIGTMIGG